MKSQSLHTNSRGLQGNWNCNNLAGNKNKKIIKFLKYQSIGSPQFVILRKIPKFYESLDACNSTNNN